MVCASGWFAATRDDYRKLGAASSCYETNAETRNVGTDCANVRPTDALFYKAEIDRKARISRLSSAGGAVVIVVVMIVTRRRRT